MATQAGHDGPADQVDDVCSEIDDGSIVRCSRRLYRVGGRWASCNTSGLQFLDGTLKLGVVVVLGNSVNAMWDV
jgi:hypothetical protein